MLAAILTACTTSISPATELQPSATTNPPAVTTTQPLATADFNAEIDLGTVPGRLLVADDPVYVVDAAGQGRIVIPEATRSSQPTWSPDGNTVAFATVSEGTPAVGLARLGDETSSMPAAFAPFYFHWSPNGQQLGYLGNGRSGFVELAVADIASGTSVSLDAGTPYYFDWAPTSDRIFSHVGTSETRIVSLDGTVVDVDTNAGLYQAPQWTEGGVLQQVTVPATIAARGARLRIQSTEQVLVLGPPEGEQGRLTEIDGLGAFESNGIEVAFTQTDSPTSIVRGTLTVLAEGGGVEVTGQPVIAFEWSPDGSRLLFLEVTGNGSIPETRWGVWERGERVMFEAFTPSLTSIGVYFPFWDQYARSQTLWSPDGNAFVYSALNTETGIALVHVQPVETNVSPSLIGEGEWASWSS